MPQDYRIVGLFEVLKFREWLIFSFFTNWSVKTGNYLEQLFLEGLCFINDQHLQNSHNLRTLKNQLYSTYVMLMGMQCVLIMITMSSFCRRLFATGN